MNSVSADRYVADPGSTAADRSRARRRMRRRLVAMVFTGLILGALLGPFVMFTMMVTEQRAPETVARADGIVVLTGPQSRIADAVDLLEDGHAERMLISGVYPSTTRGDIAAAVAANPSLFDCCVDLDYRAQNTVGNARETSRWVRHNDYETLIVVTSDYHMPRSLAEMRRELPDIDFVPYPVKSQKIDTANWWRDAGTARVMVGEYVKYVLALAGFHLGPATEDTGSTVYLAPATQ